MRRSSGLRLRAALAGLALLLGLPACWAQAPFKLGIVTFLSGPAAGPFGIPARNAAERTAELLNAGTVPSPYTGKPWQRGMTHAHGLLERVFTIDRGTVMARS